MSNGDASWSEAACEQTSTVRMRHPVSRQEPSKLVPSGHGVLQAYLERFVEDLSMACKMGEANDQW